MTRERCEARCPTHGKRCSGDPTHGPKNHTHPVYQGAHPTGASTCVWSDRDRRDQDEEVDG